MVVWRFASFAFNNSISAKYRKCVTDSANATPCFTSDCFCFKDSGVSITSVFFRSIVNLVSSSTALSVVKIITVSYYASKVSLYAS